MSGTESYQGPDYRSAEVREAFKQAVGSRVGFSPLCMSIVDRSRLSSYILDRVAQQFVGEVMSWVMAEYMNGIEVKYPTNWWQAFRERWFPKWLLDKFPVKYVKIELNYEALYPDWEPIVTGHIVRVALRRESAELVRNEMNRSSSENRRQYRDQRWP